MMINLADLKLRARERPQGYIEDVMRAGKIVDIGADYGEGTHVEISERAHRKLVKKYGPPSGPAGPWRRLREWLAARSPMVSHASYWRRWRVCARCPHWHYIRPLRIYRCGLCGCTQLKLRLAGARCPDTPPRW